MRMHPEPRSGEGSRPTRSFASLRMTLNAPLFLGLSLAAFDDGQRRPADAEGFADFGFDFGGQIDVLVQESLRILAALSDADISIREPRAGLLDDLVLQTDVDELSGLGDPFAVADVDLCLAEWCGALVLDDLDLHARADDLFAFLDLSHAADVDAHRRVE